MEFVLGVNLAQLLEVLIDQLRASIKAVKTHVHPCRECFNLTEGEVCDICRNPRRNHQVICIVEQPRDVLVIEGGVVRVPGDVEFNFHFGFPVGKCGDMDVRDRLAEMRDILHRVGRGQAIERSKPAIR